MPRCETAAVRASAVARMGYLFLFFDEMMDEEEPGRRVSNVLVSSAAGEDPG